MKIFISATIVIFAFIWWNMKAYDPVKYYNKSGLVVKATKIFNDTFTVSSATPSLNISAAGFSTILSTQAQIIQSSPTLATFMWCNVTSTTTSAVTLYITQENSGTVNVLGNLVLLGTPLQAPSSFSGTSVAVTVYGN